MDAAESTVARAVARWVVGFTGDQAPMFVASVDVHCALGRAFVHDLFWNGFWTTGLLGSVAAAAGAAEGAVLTVTGLSGRVVSRTVRVPSGMPQRPLTDTQLAVEFHACVDPVLGTVGASGLRQRLEELPALAGVLNLYGVLPSQGR